jgi:hypothetical protein
MVAFDFPSSRRLVIGMIERTGSEPPPLIDRSEEPLQL